MTRRARPLAVLAAFGLAVAAEGAPPSDFPPIQPPPDVAAIKPAAAEFTELPGVVLGMPPVAESLDVLMALPRAPGLRGGWFAAEVLC